jgi:hypothetical protein
MNDLIFKEFSAIASDKEINEAMGQLPENLNETISIVFDELLRTGKHNEKMDVFIFCLSFFQHHGGYTFYFPKLSDKDFNKLIKKPFIDIINNKSNVDFYDGVFEQKQDKKPGYVNLIKSFVQWFCYENEHIEHNKEIFIELVHALFIVTSGRNVSFGRGNAAYSYMRNLIIKKSTAETH